MHDISEILLEIRQRYVAELPTRIDTIESLILRLEEPEQFLPTFEELYRAAHSLKGSAGIHNLHILGTISHHLESQITPLGNTKSADSTEIDNLLQYLDLLRQATDLIIDDNSDFSLVEKKLASLQSNHDKENIHILMIESSKTIINITNQVFHDYTATIEFCQDGYEALKRLLLEQYDLLITNAEAPVLNGEALIAALQHSEDHKDHTVTILLTSKETSDQSKHCNEPDFTVLKNNQFIENFSATVTKAIEAIEEVRNKK